MPGPGADGAAGVVAEVIERMCETAGVARPAERKARQGRAFGPGEGADGQRKVHGLERLGAPHVFPGHRRAGPVLDAGERRALARRPLGLGSKGAQKLGNEDIGIG